MIWLLVLGASFLGLVQARQDRHAARLALVSIALLIDLAVCHALGAQAAPGGRIFGAPFGLAVSFVPAAHLAYPVLVTYATGHLGRGAVLLGVALVIAAIGTAAWSGAAWIDVAGGIALGKLIGWATFERAPSVARLARLRPY